MGSARRHLSSPTILTFGEALFTFRPLPPGAGGAMPPLSPGATPVLRAIGGAELNTAVAAANLIGQPGSVGFVSVLPTGALGDKVVRVASAAGVATDAVLRSACCDDLGTLHVVKTNGSGPRPLYQRRDSAFCTTTDAHTHDWRALLDGTSWLHLTGITPAVGPGPRAAWDAALSAAAESIQAAKATASLQAAEVPSSIHSAKATASTQAATGAADMQSTTPLRVSLDLNYRPALCSLADLWEMVKPHLGTLTLLILSEETLRALAAAQGVASPPAPAPPPDPLTSPASEAALHSSAGGLPNSQLPNSAAEGGRADTARFALSPAPPPISAAEAGLHSSAVQGGREGTPRFVPSPGPFPISADEVTREETAGAGWSTGQPSAADLLVRMRQVWGVPLLACCFKRPLGTSAPAPQMHPGVASGDRAQAGLKPHTGGMSQEADTAHAVDGAGNAYGDRAQALLKPLARESGLQVADTTHGGGGVRRWSLIAHPSGLASTEDVPTEHTPVEALGGGDAWVAGFIHAAVYEAGVAAAVNAAVNAAVGGAAVGGSAMRGEGGLAVGAAGSGAGGWSGGEAEVFDPSSAVIDTGGLLNPPSAMNNTGGVLDPMSAFLRLAARRGDLLAGLKMASLGDLSGVSGESLRAAEALWDGVPAQLDAVSPPSLSSEESCGARPSGAAGRLPQRFVAGVTGLKSRASPPQSPAEGQGGCQQEWAPTPEEDEVFLRLEACGIVPVVAIDDPKQAVRRLSASLPLPAPNLHQSARRSRPGKEFDSCGIVPVVAIDEPEQAVCTSPSPTPRLLTSIPPFTPIKHVHSAHARV
jgi:sugar/nucleoside kinase (ribokinase family)